AGLPPKSLSNSGQRGLTGRLRSKADQERLASHRGYRLLLQPKSCVDTYGHRRQASSHLLTEVAVKLNPVIVATFNPEEQECHDVDIFSS
ncbi:MULTISPECIES: hypothetical protein, partial [Pseudomonas]|uniref:hypothetical protein n=1 Tax=Pseudomonas TaxID=286 RepID=UPI001F483B7F